MHWPLIACGVWQIPGIKKKEEGTELSMIQAGLIGVIGAVLAIQLKAGRAEYGIYVCVAAGVILFSMIVDRLGIFIRTVEQITSYINLDAEYLVTLFKMIGVTYIAEFSAGICRDAGYQTLAGQIEIFGKLTILVMGLPVLLALLQTIQEFLS